MSGKGTKKPLKAPKKGNKDLDDDDKEHLAKLAAAKKAEEAMRKSLAGKSGPLNTGKQGVKKSGNK